MNMKGLAAIAIGFSIMFFSMFAVGNGPFWLLGLVVGALFWGFGWMILWEAKRVAKGKSRKAKGRSVTK